MPVCRLYAQKGKESIHTMRLCSVLLLLFAVLLSTAWSGPFDRLCEDYLDLSDGMLAS